MNFFRYTRHVSFLLALFFSIPAVANQHMNEPSRSEINQEKDFRAEYRKEINARIQEVKNQLNLLDKESKNMSQKARRNFKDMKNDTQDELKGLEDQWRDFSKKTDAQWNQAKVKLDRSWDQFMNNFNQQKKQITKEKS